MRFSAAETLFEGRAAHAAILPVGGFHADRAATGRVQTLKHRQAPARAPFVNRPPDQMIGWRAESNMCLNSDMPSICKLRPITSRSGSLRPSRPAILVVLPIIIVFLMSQKHVRSGLNAGAKKG